MHGVYVHVYLLVYINLGNTFKMVLTLYEADRTSKSPTRNEVLICTEQTRGDEVICSYALVDKVNRLKTKNNICSAKTNCHEFSQK